MPQLHSAAAEPSAAGVTEVPHESRGEGEPAEVVLAFASDLGRKPESPHDDLHLAKRAPLGGAVLAIECGAADREDEIPRASSCVLGQLICDFLRKQCIANADRAVASLARVAVLLSGAE